MVKYPSNTKERFYFVSSLILFLSIITTIGIYGSPFKRINLWINENGRHLYEPLSTQTLIAQVLGIPAQILTYTLHFEYKPENQCPDIVGYQAYVRLDVREDEPFAKYASQVFDEKSCYFDDGYMEQNRGGQYHFCLIAPGKISFSYPANQPISFSSILFSNNSCVVDLGTFKNDERLRFEDLKFYANPSKKEWLIGFIGVSLAWVLITGGLFTLREYIRKG